MSAAPDDSCAAVSFKRLAGASPMRLGSALPRGWSTEPGAAGAGPDPVHQLVDLEAHDPFRFLWDSAPGLRAWRSRTLPSPGIVQCQTFPNWRSDSVT